MNKVIKTNSKIRYNKPPFGFSASAPLEFFVGFSASAPLEFFVGFSASAPLGEFRVA